MNTPTKRDLLLEESLQLIHEKGFKATTMRDLAERMGYKVSNIYNFIDSKQSLLERYLFDISGEFHKGANQICNSALSPTEKLKAVISLHVQLTTNKPYEVGLLVNEWRNLKEPKLSNFLDEKAEYQSKVREIIKEGIEAGDLNAFDLDVVTHLVLSSVRWLYDWYINHTEEVNPVELNRQITNFILSGVMKK
ncbi:MAG: TetR/AcrR family transcriptional regulator [Balneolaceae bacterium]|nr:TetR/AcrR family transcriptional regulator [Balneolaceae bacterium]